jgi:Leucine-rich repeat (LRR) protein
MKWYFEDLNEWIKNGCDNEIALQITELDLFRYSLTKIPVEIGNLINLQILEINNNYKLTTIPVEIGNLTKLQILSLINNNLTTIPSEIGNLIKLQELHLNNNKLTTIPTEIGNLINLKKLKFDTNKLTTIPREIGNLKNLQELYLYFNDLTIIPAELGNLINLQTLYMYNNNLKTIPIEIGNLINLQYLSFSYNKLRTIPTEIGNLIKLRELSFSNNKLTTIPITITNLKLYQFHYNNNPIEYIPPQVIRYLDRNKTTKKIYNDNQSVHNHAIQDGIKNSINYIMSIKPIYKLYNLNDIIIRNNFINNQTKTILFEYINCQDVHSILNITFAELLINVISFIDRHDAKVEIYKVLEQEMNDTIYKCFTCRMSRLINCLNGFDDHIVINISNNKQI